MIRRQPRSTTMTPSFPKRRAADLLRGTTVRTNIQTGGVEETRIFGLIEEAKTTRKTFDGRMLDLEITLSDWVYRSVISRSEEHTSELQSLMRISYAVFCLKKKNKLQPVNR